MVRPLFLAAALLAGAAVSAFATEPEELKQLVQDELIARPYLDAGWVRVRAERRTITLAGRVPSELVHAIVVRSVRNVPGVKVVKDKVKVDPSLPAWVPTRTERTRLRLENARRAVRADARIGQLTTLHVARSRFGVIVTGDVSTVGERVRARELVTVTPEMKVENRVRVRPDACRRSEARPPEDEPTLAWLRSVSDAVAREPLLAGLVAVTATLERGALVLRGWARTLEAHDLAVEIARGMLRERRGAAERARAGSGELTKLLAGDPEPVLGEVPSSLESLVIVEPGP